MCKITEELTKPLDRRHVAQRTQGGSKVSYIEGWHAINEANRIFGFLAWDMETVYSREVSAEKNSNGNHIIGYEAKVRITVRHEGQTVVREGTGHGSGIAKMLFDAYEGAAKEAETDAFKRAIKSFGNPFGLALYDKSQANVDNDAAEREAKEAAAAELAAKEAAAKDWLAGFTDDITKAESHEALVSILEQTTDRRNRIAAAYPTLKTGMDAAVTRAEERFKPENILAAG